MTRKMAQGHKITPIRRSLTMVLLFTLIAITARTLAQSPSLPKPPERPTPRPAIRIPPDMSPRRSCRTGRLPPATADGNFILGSTHISTPENSGRRRVGPQTGIVIEFTMKSTDSKIYPGIARDAAPSEPPIRGPGQADRNHQPSRSLHRRWRCTSRSNTCAGSAAPFIVGADGPDQGLFSALDNLIAADKVPVMVAISIGNGGGDAQGSQRGLEYDTMSGDTPSSSRRKSCPWSKRKANVKLTKDPDGRATTGGSSGGSCALIMAWYHPDLYHRVLTYSGTYVNQQWPYNPETPHGAWEFHEHLIPNSPVKPIRIWMEVGDRDLLNPNVMRDNMHDWVVANENMAKVLADKGYHYQFVFARNAGHVDGRVKQQTSAALEYVWRGMRIRLGRSNPSFVACVLRTAFVSQNGHLEF